MTAAGGAPVCRRFLVSGRVQGVWYRASTREQALRLGLSGYARNLDDGRVEVLACGDNETIEKLRDWLREGPPLAEVSEVNEVGGEKSRPSEYTGFGTS